jgi:hypothetical protein
MKIPKAVPRAIIERMSGGRPSRVSATISAAVAGGAVAASVYRGLRSQ